VTLTVVNPFDQSTVAELPLDTDTQIAEKLDCATTAFSAWSRMRLDERAAIIRTGLERLRNNSEQIVRDVTLQMGKPLSQSRGELATLFDRAETCLELAANALSPDVLPPKPGFVRRIEHVPLGVVFDIAAWNYPLIIPINVIVPALLCGNTVLLKHSAKTPLCGRQLADAFGRLAVPDLVTDVVITHDQTARLIADRRVHHVSFTGSVAGGREIARHAAERLIDTGLELGGNDPAYVAADADLDFAVANLVDGACYNAGQSCCGVERVYVHETLYDDFLRKAEAALQDHRLGNPLDDQTTLGPLASKGAINDLEHQVRDAVERGGRLLCGGSRVPDVIGNFFAPTLLADVPQEAVVMQEESFGPLLPVASVTDDAQAVALMNDSRFGLTASVWTNDQERAERFASQINAGTIFQNRCDYLDPALPWTGVGESGKGSTLSRYGFWHLTRRKSIHFRTET